MAVQFLVHELQVRERQRDLTQPNPDPDPVRGRRKKIYISKTDRQNLLAKWKRQIGGNILLRHHRFAEEPDRTDGTGQTEIRGKPKYDRYMRGDLTCQ